MKKTISLLLTLMLMLFLCISASAAGKLTVNTETMTVVESYSYYYTYVFAELTNTGDKTVQYNACLMEVLDADGEALGSKDYGSCYPEYLEPGETAYLMVYDYTDDKTVIPQDYILTVAGKSSSSNPVHRLPATVELREVPRGYGNYVDKVAYTTITNDTEGDVFDYVVVIIARNAEGNVIGLMRSSTGYSGIPAGGIALNAYNMNYENTIEAAEAAGVEYTLEVLAYCTND